MKESVEIRISFSSLAEWKLGMLSGLLGLMESEVGKVGITAIEENGVKYQITRANAPWGEVIEVAYGEGESNGRVAIVVKPKESDSPIINFEPETTKDRDELRRIWRAFTAIKPRLVH